MRSWLPALCCAFLAVAESAVVLEAHAHQDQDDCAGYKGSSCDECTDGRVTPCPRRCEGGGCPTSCDSDCTPDEEDPEERRRAQAATIGCNCQMAGGCDDHCDQGCDGWGCDAGESCCDHSCDHSCDTCLQLGLSLQHCTAPCDCPTTTGFPTGRPTNSPTGYPTWTCICYEKLETCDHSCDRSCDHGCDFLGTFCDDGCDDCDESCDQCGGECSSDCVCPPPTSYPTQWPCNCYRVGCTTECDTSCDSSCDHHCLFPGQQCDGCDAGCDGSCDEGCTGCGGDCSSDCVCPTAEPTRFTLAPMTPVTGAPNNGTGNFVPSVSPTASPGCPVDLAIDFNSAPSFQCRCDTIDGSTVPFNDVAHSYCPGTMPSEWIGALHFTCPHCFNVGTQFNISCPNSWTACDVYLLVYHCPGCDSASFNGGWVQNLGDEWRGRHCAPKFCENGDQALAHNMISFNKQVPGGTPLTLPATTTSKSYYFGIVVKQVATVCASHTDSANCTTANAGSTGCAWESGECVNAFCPPVNPGGSSCGAPCPPKDCP
eukprot:TRINITY_DN660_c1_g2_i3.p1 TRINITY_DN660_c1_g2~~TRINITY_DN660_c1_g2_i3.p1  ORF type:complete len:569 (+),score=100.33 TRINITY_DN660_c1_g2_i3:88-1707(+)